MRALITGDTGHLGEHLARLLVNRRAVVLGVSRRAGSGIEGVTHVPLDLADRTETLEVIRSFRPTDVFHLAGITRSADTPGDILQRNLEPAVSLFEALAAAGLAAKVLLVSSSAVYGAGRGPLSEEAPVAPLSLYGTSKAVQELVGAYYRRRYDLHIVVVRLFNLIGPGLAESLLAGDVASQIVHAERGGSSRIEVGNLDAARDFVDVRDAVRACSLALEHGSGGQIFNVSTGTMHTARECVELLMSMSRVPLTLSVERGRFRTNDVPAHVGDSTLLRRMTGWRPEIAFERSLADLLDQRRKAAAEKG